MDSKNEVKCLECGQVYKKSEPLDCCPACKSHVYEPIAPFPVEPEKGDASTYLSPKGTSFSFSGWRPGESPTECFERNDMAACVHGLMLSLTVIGDPKLSHDSVSDDGILHELIHLLAGIDISTHSTVSNLRDDIFLVQRLAMAKIAGR